MSWFWEGLPLSSPDISARCSRGRLLRPVTTGELFLANDADGGGPAVRVCIEDSKTKLSPRAANLSDYMSMGYNILHSLLKTVTST